MRKNFIENKINFLFDRNYNYSESFNIFDRLKPVNSKLWILKGIVRFIAQMFASLLNNEINYLGKKGIEVLLISFSQNNFRVLNEINQKVKCSFIIGKSSEKAYFGIPRFYAYLGSLPYFFLLILIYLKCDDYQKKAIRTFFPIFLLTFGYDKLSHRILRRTKPKVIIVANDHIMQSRTFTRNALKNNIKTVFIQHAGSSIRFPSLHYNVSFLDGFNSLIHYSSKKTIEFISSKIFLVGVPRLRPLIDLKKEKNYKNQIRNVIGIGMNRIDSISHIEKLIADLIINLEYHSIILRPHPSISLNKEITNIIEKYKIELSDPKEESIVDFFRKTHYIIAYRSFIIFEAALAGVLPIFFNMSTTSVGDGYGYVANGFLREYKSSESIIKDIKTQSVTFDNSFIERNVYNLENQPDSLDSIIRIIYDLISNNSDLNHYPIKYYMGYKYYTIH